MKHELEKQEPDNVTEVRLNDNEAGGTQTSPGSHVILDEGVTITDVFRHFKVNAVVIKGEQSIHPGAYQLDHFSKNNVLFITPETPEDKSVLLSNGHRPHR